MTFEMQKKRQSWHEGNITDWTIDLYSECSKYLQTLAQAGDRLNNTPPPYENLNIFKSA